MDDYITVYAIDAVNKCSRVEERVAVALSAAQKATAQRLGMAQEELIARVCAQAGLDVLRIGESVCLSATLHCGDAKEGAEMRDMDEVRCPLSLGPWPDCPPLLCALYACDAFSTSCNAILSAAEAALEKERPP